MRDLLITMIVFGAIPFILMRPHIGILAWSWISYMNPHRLTWGFAYSFPFAQVIAIASLIAMVMSREPKRFPINGITILWFAFLLWVTLTTVFAHDFRMSLPELERVMKIQLFALLTVVWMRSKERIDLLIWVIVVSLGFFAVKGGAFTILTAGNFRVWGPPDSYVYDNNSLALATLMLLPLAFYLRKQFSNKWIRLAFVAASVLMLVSAIGSQSRGALLACVAVGVFFWLKSSKKVMTAVIIVAFGAGLFTFMPQHWHDRMNTITEYEEDGSAMGRINAWEMAFNLANDRPFGAGFRMWSPEMYQRYSPVEETWNHSRTGHSIYFNVLGEHGWIGLALFMSIFFLAWRAIAKTCRLARQFDDLKWVVDLLRMVEISGVAYAVGGAFLPLSYFDLPWHMLAIVVVCKDLVDVRVKEVAKDRIALGSGALSARGGSPG